MEGDAGALRGGTGDVGALVILVLVVFWCGVIDVWGFSPDFVVVEFA